MAANVTAFVGVAALGLLTRPSAKAGLDRFIGIVLIALGIRLATESR